MDTRHAAGGTGENGVFRTVGNTAGLILGGTQNREGGGDADVISSSESRTCVPAMGDSMIGA